MEKINSIGTDLFNKIRGRFSNVVIGDVDGNVVSDPADARFFDFEYTSNGLKVGKVSVSVNDEDLTVIYSKDLLADKPDTFKDEWYEFLKEMRKFAKRRLLQFDVRDITKTNLTKRDYQFLANTRGGEDRMNESRMYGTARTSYQKVDNARIVIRHTAPINTESTSARTQHISAIYIESAEGERFKYPYKHLSGARAMARHVSEGGKLYDDFGSHIVSLSEEMNKLRKFKSYMGKSNVMAESLVEYMDVVNNRINEVKKTIDRLQKPAYYSEAIGSFEKPILEDVPSDVADSWIDQLTIKQFNEELKDVFPYIYRLVGEAKQAEIVALEDIVDESDPCWKNYKQIGMKNKDGRKVPNCVPEEIELEQAFEAILGQFADDPVLKKKVSEAYDEDQSRWPLVKFKEKKLSTGASVLQALVNPAAYSPDAFDRGSPDTMAFNIVPPSVNADGKIYHTLEQMMSTLKRKNSTSGITLVIDKALDALSTQKKYNYVFDWLRSKPRSELSTVVAASEKELPEKKGPVIFVDVRFNTGEVRTIEGGRLRPLELLIDPSDKNYDGNPFVQGTPVELVDSDVTSTGGDPKRRDIIKPADRKADPRGGAPESTLSQGQQGVVVRSRVHKKEEKKFYANQQFKDLRAKIQEPYEKVIVTNSRAFFKLRSDYYDQVFKPYYKPNRGMFEIPPNQLESFKSIVYSPEFEKAVGNPELYFLNDLEADQEVPADIIKTLPKNVQELIKGNYSNIDYTDDNNAERDTTKGNSGPFSNTSFKSLVNMLGKYGLSSQFTISREDFKQMEPIGRDKIKFYMDELADEKDMATAKDIAAELIMLQDIFPAVQKEREQAIRQVLSQRNLNSLKEIMLKWFDDGAKLNQHPGKPLDAVPGMPGATPKMPAGNTPTPAPSAPTKISDESLKRLGELVNDRNVIIDYVKEVAVDILDKEYRTSAMSLNMLKNRVNRADSKERVYQILSDLDQRKQGNAVISKTLRPVIQDIERQQKDKFVRAGKLGGPRRNESIEEAKDYNFTADDIAQIAQMRDINAAKQQALKLITSDSRRPMSKDKIGYFTNVIQSKRNIDALIKMLYDMMLSGEGHGVIGTANSIKPSRYRQTYGEETVESNLEEKVNWKAIAVALGIGAAGLGMLKQTGAENTPLGQSLQAAAEQGDQKAAQYLEQLNGLIDAGNNGAIQYIAKQYPPANESKKEDAESKKVPFTEFIMSHFDRHTGQFPKGETSVLTMVEKDYGEKYIEPSKKFIERLTALHDNYQMQSNPQQMEAGGLDRIKRLAGL